MAIRRCAADAVLRHARDDLPNECCGLLIGGSGLIDRAARARNLRPAPDRYLVDPADHCAAIRSARAAGLRVIGVYHSHPAGPLAPSAVDQREASYREFVYLIVTARNEIGDGKRMAGYRLRDAGFEEIALEVVP